MWVEENNRETEKLPLWHLFIVGRSAVTGVLLVILLLIVRITPSQKLLPAVIVAGLQFITNGLYLYLWKKRDLSFLGYFCFSLEIALITLLILSLGHEGHVFVLAYLWPIIMGGWLIGHQATLPLTLLSSVAYASLLWLGQKGLWPEQISFPNGTPLAFALCPPYLVFNAFLVWALTIEIEHGKERLHARNQELWRMNTGLRALVQTSEKILSSLNLEELAQAAISQAQKIARGASLSLYLRQGNELVLHWPKDQDSSQARLPLPSALQTTPNARNEGKSSTRTLIHLRSPRGLEGMLCVHPQEGGLDGYEIHLLQLLGHQVGIGIENARLFSSLRHERNLLRNILLNMGEAVFVVDDQGRVLLANRMAHHLLQVREGQPLPSDLSEHLSSNTESHYTIEIGERILSISIAELAGERNLPPSTIYVARDITHELQAERMKADFVTYASHELRTPLTTIKMMVRLLLLDTPRDSPSRKYLEIINSQVERQTRLVNNLLDFAKLEAGRYELPLEEVYPRQVIQDVLDACRPLAEEKGLQLNTHISLAPERIISNASGLEQVLVNLVSNAIKFTERGGEVSLSCWQKGKEVFFAVQDTGIGMSEEELTHIFTKFYTIRRARRKGEGTGLGLVISEMIVKKLGGQIKVTSQVGKGSCFTVCLPLERPKPASSSPEEKENAPSGGVNEPSPTEALTAGA